MKIKVGKSIEKNEIYNGSFSRWPGNF